MLIASRIAGMLWAGKMEMSRVKQRTYSMSPHSITGSTQGCNLGCIAQDPTALNRRKARKASERRIELTMQERFQDVKDFWLKQAPARRRQLLKVPIRRLLQGVHPRHVVRISMRLPASKAD